MVKTLHDWEVYIRQLAGPALRSKAIAANTQTFVDALRSDGTPMSEVAQVIRLFVLQMATTGEMIPMGGVYDLVGIAETDPMVMDSKRIDPATVAQMVANPPLEADLEDVWDNDLS